MVEVDVADLLHAAREEGVANRGREHDGDEDGVLRGLEGVLTGDWFQRDSDLGRCGQRSCTPCVFKGFRVDLGGLELGIGGYLCQ